MPARALALAGLVVAGSQLAMAQDYPETDSEELRSRIQRLERDLRDMQQEVYRGGATAPRSLAPPPVDVPPGQSAPLAQRLADMEATIQTLTGQIEELQNQNRTLTTKVERLQRQLDYQQSGGATGTGPGDSASHGGASPSTAAAEPPSRTLAPGPTTLGTIPAGTPMPVPKPGVSAGAAAPPAGQRVAALPPSAGGAGGAQAEYESAMALLRKAQYAAAQQAFRAFADAHPQDARAPDALFWTGDIAYSARRDYASAARAFAELLKKYSKAGRAPEGMLKLGLSLLGLGQKQEGCATLAALPVKYANAAPALIARAAAERKRAACT
jgi:tol-pal system protein YbgF